jgi:hypothetical protein
MPNKWWLIVPGVVALVVIVWIATGIIGNRTIQKAKNQIAQLESEVATLTGKREAVEKDAAAKETEYLKRIATLNGRLLQLQKEKQSIEGELAKFKKQRESIVIPADPGGVCDQFVRVGFRSCTTVK